MRYTIVPPTDEEISGEARQLRDRLRSRERSFLFTVQHILGAISRDQLTAAETAAQPDGSILRQLRLAGVLTSDRVSELLKDFVLSTWDPCPPVTPTRAHLEERIREDPTLPDLLPPGLREEHTMLALRRVGWNLWVVMPEPFDVLDIPPRDLEGRCRMVLHLLRAPRDEILAISS